MRNVIFVLAFIATCLSPLIAFAQDDAEWTPLSPAMITALRGERLVMDVAVEEGLVSVWAETVPTRFGDGAFFRTQQDDPMQEAYRRLSGLDLSNHSRDLSTACSELRSLAAAVEADIVAVSNALDFRTSDRTQSQPQPAPDEQDTLRVLEENSYRWDWPDATDDDRNTTEIALRRLRKATEFEASFNTYLGDSFLDLICGSSHGDRLSISSPWQTESGAVLFQYSTYQPLTDASLDEAVETAIQENLDRLRPYAWTQDDGVVETLVVIQRNLEQLEDDMGEHIVMMTESGSLSVAMNTDGTLTRSETRPEDIYFVDERLTQLVRRLTEGRHLRLTISDIRPALGSAYLDLSNITLASLSLNDVQFQNINLRDSVIGNVQIRRSVLGDVYAQRIVADYFTIRDTAALPSNDATPVLDIQSAQIGSFTLLDLRPSLYVKLEGDIVTEAAVRQFSADIDRTAGHSINIERSRLGNIYVSETNIRGEIGIRDVSATDLWVSKSDAEVLRLNNSDFTGDINLWGARLARVFIVGTSARDLDSFYATIGSLEIYGLREDGQRRPAQFDEIVFKRSEIEIFSLTNSRLTNLRLSSLRSGLIDLGCLSVDGQVNLTSASANSFWASRVDAELMSLEAAYIQDVWFARSAVNDQHTSQQDDDDSATVNPDGGTPSFEGNDAGINSPAQQTPPTSEVDGQQNFCDGEQNAPLGDFGQINLDGASIDALTLTGRIEETLSMRQAEIGRMTFAGDRAGFGRGAEWSLRGTSIDSIAMPHNAFQTVPNGDPMRLDIDGAQIGLLRIFDPCRDQALSDDSEPEQADCDAAQDYDTFLYTQMLPALRLTAADHDVTNYRGADYAFLRRSLEDAGKPRLAQEVAILQNDHYAQTLAKEESWTSWGLASLYRVGSLINKYGYNNGRALMLLMLLWAFGVSVLLMEKFGPREWWRFQGFAQRVRSKVSKNSEQLIDQRRQEPPVGDLPWWESFFLSADRIVPTMALDEDFSRPDRSKHARRTPDTSGALHIDVRRHGFVIAVLYVQRLAAFIIVLFMLGGVLDVFQ